MSNYMNTQRVLGEPTFISLRHIEDLLSAHSNINQDSRSQNLGEYLSSWQSFVSEKNNPKSGLLPPTIAYNILDNSISLEAIIAQLIKAGDDTAKNQMQHTKYPRIPRSFQVWFVVCLASSLFFGALFYCGFTTHNYILNPWVSLSLVIASLGLTITVIVAMIEWKYGSHERQKQAKKKTIRRKHR